MDFNIEIRKKQLDHLDQLISSSRDRIESVLKYLGWTADKVEKEDALVPCPLNPHHKISPKSWNDHIEKCLTKLEGYDLKEQFLSESLENSNQSIYLDRNKKIELITKELSEKGALRLEKDYKFDEVITQLNTKKSIFINIFVNLAWNGLDPDPRTSDRLMSTYSQDERLIFYNYSVANTVGPPPPPEFTTSLHNKQRHEEKPLSYEELLAQERDAKRRRTKYRSVHINRKNHTEVIREVINGQMEEYKEWLQEQKRGREECNNGTSEDRREEERPHSSTSRNSNRSSSSRSTSRRHDRHRERSRERHRRSKEHDRYRKRSPREIRSKSNSSHEGRRSSRDRKSRRDDHSRRR